MTNPTIYFISMPAEKVLLMDAGVDRRDIIECWGTSSYAIRSMDGRKVGRMIVSMELPAHEEMWSAIYEVMLRLATLYGLTVELTNIYYLAQKMRKAAEAIRENQATNLEAFKWEL